MAYTKIIKVKSNLNLCLDYTSNPKKTERRNAEDLNRLLNYTQNSDKTEHQLYVSGFNCIPQNAYEIMMETKIRWRKPVKDGNILAYHIIQSFSPGEATPDQVHQIGCEFAQRFLADRFECTVSTHLDRGHLHNHIVVNSVSYKDGKMFRSDFDAYYKGIRKISDELCRENRLSVIETDGKGKSYAQWMAEQDGKPTWRTSIRLDIRDAVAESFTWKQFLDQMKQRGYQWKLNRKYIALKAPGMERYIRLRSLGKNYSEEGIRQWILQPKSRTPAGKEGASRPPKKKLKGIQALYYSYLYQMGVLKQKPKRISPVLRADIRKLDARIEQMEFLQKHQITTREELLVYRIPLEEQVQALTKERKRLYRSEPDSARIGQITEELKPLRKDIRLCIRIEQQSREMEEKMRLAEQIQRQEEEQTEKNRKPRTESR